MTVHAMMSKDITPMNKFYSRKFVMTLLTYFGTVVLLYKHLIDSGAYTTVTLGIVGGFITGSIFEQKLNNEGK
jgi:hypothetical protein